MMTRSNYRHLTSLILTFLIQGTFAANIVVNTTTDDENAGDGKCTLREAINNANTNSDTTKKDCKSGNAIDVINLTNLHGQITLTYGELKILSDIRFQGADANTLIISGNKQSRIFKIESGQVEIDKVTIANGKEYEYCPKELPTTAGRGGGIYNSGNLIIRNSIISNNIAQGYDCFFGDGNSASSAEGGGIYNEGTLTIEQVTFSGNLAYGGELSKPNYCDGYEAQGGGIYNSGTLIIDKGIFSNNSAVGNSCLWTVMFGNSSSGYGGGIYSRNGVSTIKNSTFSKNLAHGGEVEALMESSVAGNAHGGGIYLGFSHLGNSIANSTFVENSAKGGSSTSPGDYVDVTGGDGFGGGVSTRMASLRITNSTFSENLVKGGDSQTVGGESYGGGIYIGYETEFFITNSTLFGNSAIGGKGNGDFSQDGKSYGGGVASKKGKFLSIKNTIIANSIGEDCYTSGGNLVSFNNLIKDGTCEPKYTGNPRLGVLRNNGGTTMTHRLLIDSIARDAGDDTICAAEPVNGLDQRGAPRTGMSAGTHCDIGAFELQPSDLVELIEFTAIPNEKSILFKWETGAERHTAGFYLWQAEPLEGNCEQFTHEIKLTDKAIPSQGNENEGAYYEYRYEGPINASDSCYGLEERETSGKRNFYIIGPGIEKWKTFSIE
jgi:CSLREA domain-containing protein